MTVHNKLQRITELNICNHFSVNVLSQFFTHALAQAQSYTPICISLLLRAISQLHLGTFQKIPKKTFIWCLKNQNHKSQTFLLIIHNVLAFQQHTMYIEIIVLNKMVINHIKLFPTWLLLEKKIKLNPHTSKSPDHLILQFHFS